MHILIILNHLYELSSNYDNMVSEFDNMGTILARQPHHISFLTMRVDISLESVSPGLFSAFHVPWFKHNYAIVIIL